MFAKVSAVLLRDDSCKIQRLFGGFLFDYSGHAHYYAFFGIWNKEGKRPSRDFDVVFFRIIAFFEIILLEKLYINQIVMLFFEKEENGSCGGKLGWRFKKFRISAFLIGLPFLFRKRVIGFCACVLKGIECCKSK